MKPCLACKKPVDTFINFGKMPIANGFLTPPEFQNEFFFELKTGYCPACHMVQLTEFVDPSKLFHENYAYFSSISTRMADHFKQFASWLRETYVSPEKPFVVELGSNDGIMLKHIAAARIPHLGVEPSANVAQVARNNGVNTLSEFFNEETARKILTQYGHADSVSGANVICHIPDMHSIIRGLDILLKPKGVFIFEDPYLGDIVAKASYDQIYDEHYYYFSLHSVANLFAPHGMEIVDALPQHTHGGSMRYVIARKGARPVSPAVSALMQKELAQGLTKPETYANLAKRIHQSKTDLVNLLKDLKAQGKRVVGYGATSKSTTVTNFCGIGPDLVEFISDTTPGKQGKFSPGTHIPIFPYDKFKSRYPEYALLFAWNHGEEIIAKETAFTQAGGKFIVYVPKVEIKG